LQSDLGVKTTQECYVVGIKYSIRDLIPVLEAAMWGKISIKDKIAVKNPKRRKDGV